MKRSSLFFVWVEVSPEVSSEGQGGQERPEYEKGRARCISDHNKCSTGLPNQSKGKGVRAGEPMGLQSPSGRLRVKGRKPMTKATMSYL